MRAEPVRWQARSSVISAKTLNERITQGDVTVLLVTIKDPFSGAYPELPEKLIPGTRILDMETQASLPTSALPHTLPSPQAFAKAMNTVGVTRQKDTVIYDLKGIFSAARLWWMLKSFGITNVWVMDGGFEAWQKAGLPTAEPECDSTPNHDIHRQQFASGHFLNKDEMVSLLSVMDTTQILDARAEARYQGNVEEPRAGLRRGHIPGAKNLPYTALLQDGHLMPDTALKAVFQQCGIDLNASLVTYCGSGVTACILLLAAHQLGSSVLSVYDGSWSEWGADPNLPLEAGEADD